MMGQKTFHVSADDPRNLKLIRQVLVKQGKETVPPIASPDVPGPDPYWERGSHPEIVERVWDQLGPALPIDCRSILYGTPALVAPVSGIALAVAWGTAYVIRVPEDAVAVAIKAGAKTVMRWAGGTVMDTSRELGPDWLFGAWLTQEPQWCLQCFKAAEGA